ncbi:MAG: hypothetical protein ACKOCE_03770 [Acidimicrobiia bacterium]
MNERPGPTRLLAFVFTATSLMVACGGGDGSSDTLAPLPTNVSTTVESTLAPMVSTTGVPAATTTTIAATTTTVPKAAELVLSPDSLGSVRFGVDPEGAIVYVTSLLGEPDSDSGYVDAVSDFGFCPGSQVRGVRWGDLLMLFGDDSTVASGRLHFYGWRFGPARSSVHDPMGPATAGGVTLGSTVNELLAAHPSADVVIDDVYGAGFDLDFGGRGLVSGSLTDDSPNGVIVDLFGGVNCRQWAVGI